MNEMKMFDKTKRILAAKLCFFVFFAKMIISATPIFGDRLDSSTILQIVLQLELEQTTKKCTSSSEDVHESGNKVFKVDHIDYLGFIPLVEGEQKAQIFYDNEKALCSYHPSVPTPPPNC